MAGGGRRGSTICSGPHGACCGGAQSAEPRNGFTPTRTRPFLALVTEGHGLTHAALAAPAPAPSTAGGEGAPGPGPGLLTVARPRLVQDLGALKIPDQYRMTIWRGLQDLKQSHDYGAQQLIRSSSNASTISIGSSGELQRQRVMEAVHFRVRHTITIPNRGAPAGGAGPDEWADFGFDLPDCKSRKQSIKEEFMESEIH